MGKHVIVVGGGIAGLAAAVYLARGGRTVTLFEKRRSLGGRAVTHLRRGFRFNLGPHAVYRGGAASRIYAELGIPIRGGTPKRRGIAMFRDREGRIPASLLSILFTGALTTSRAKIEALRLFVTLKRESRRVSESMTVREWLDTRVSDAELRGIVAAMIRLATYSDDTEHQSAAAALRQLVLARRGVIYIDEGWQKIVDALHSAAVAAGVNFVTSSRIVGLDHDGSVRGIELGGLELEDTTDTLNIALPDMTPEGVQGAKLPAETVVLAVDPFTAAELVGDAGLTQPWTSPRPVKLSTLDVALSRLPDPKRTFALGIDDPFYFSVHSAYSHVTPKGGALIHAARYGDKPADEKHLESVIDRLQPGWRELVVHRRFLPALTVSNALVTPGTRRPSPATSIRGLYIAGDWVGDEGLLSDAALTSARAAALAILATSS